MTRSTPICSVAAIVAAALLVLAAVFVPGSARATMPGGSGGVAFVAGSGAAAKVCVQRLDGSSPRCVSAPWAGEVALQPLSGRWLVVLVPIGGANALYAVDTQAEPLSTPTLMGPTGLTPSDVTWLDDSTIAYTAGGDIYTVHVGGDGKLADSPVNRTNTPETESDPTWLPNFRIGYVRDGNLWTMGTAGQNQKCVKKAPGSGSCYVTAAEESDLNFSIAGLYYTADGNVYRLKLNKESEITQAPVAVAATGSLERGPAPSPSGKELVFERDGALVHMKNATTTMDEQQLDTGFPQTSAADWGSLFTFVVMPQQKPYDVKVEMHGTFAIVDFKTKQPEDDFVTVTLVDVDTGHIAAAYPKSATKTWSDVVVKTLVPGAHYTLHIDSIKWWYEHPKTFTALTRHVNVTIQNVHMIDDADDFLAGAGDFKFGFRVFAPGSGQDEHWLNLDMDSGENWPAFFFVPLQLPDAPESFVSIQAFGVDEDCILTFCSYDPLGAGWDLDVYSEWGPWATKTTNVGLSPDSQTPLDEELTRPFSMTAHGSSGEPDFSVTGTVEVTYG